MLELELFQYLFLSDFFISYATASPQLEMERVIACQAWTFLTIFHVAGILAFQPPGLSFKFVYFMVMSLQLRNNNLEVVIDICQSNLFRSLFISKLIMILSRYGSYPFCSQLSDDLRKSFCILIKAKTGFTLLTTFLIPPYHHDEQLLIQIDPHGPPETIFKVFSSNFDAHSSLLLPYILVYKSTRV